MTGFTTTDLANAAQRLADAAEAAAAELNEQDGLLGDGDIGITVSRGWREVAEAELPDDVGKAFLEAAKAFQRASPSSYGTLTATALMAAAKATKGRDTVDWAEVSGLLAAARDAMMARGKGELGQKSVLDMMDALAHATQGIDEPGRLAAAANDAATSALDDFRGRTSGLGRARMFGEKSVGVDDPGMLALRRVLDGLLATQSNSRDQS